MIRLGMTLGIKEEKIEEYKKLHANVWPEVLENLTELNFKNYSIYLYKNTLFGSELGVETFSVLTPSNMISSFTVPLALGPIVPCKSINHLKRPTLQLDISLGVL